LGAQAGGDGVQIAQQVVASPVLVSGKLAPDGVQARAVQLAGIAGGVVRMIGGPGLQRLAGRELGGALGEVLAQERDLVQIDAASRIAQGAQRRQRDLRRDAGMAVAVAADPRRVAQQRRQVGPVGVRIVGMQAGAQVVGDIEQVVHDH